MTRQQMPNSFTGVSNIGLLNRLTSQCEVSVAWDPNGSQQQPQSVSFTALWDTGATHSVVTQNVVDACGLEIEDFLPEAHHAYGTVTNVPRFYVNLRLPNLVGIQGVRVSLGILLGVDVLIGMDIICMGDFAVTNKDSKTKFSFRIPSIADIDFVKEDNERIRKEKEHTRKREFLQSKAANASNPSTPKRRRRKR